MINITWTDLCNSETTMPFETWFLGKKQDMTLACGHAAEGWHVGEGEIATHEDRDDTITIPCFMRVHREALVPEPERRGVMDITALIAQRLAGTEASLTPEPAANESAHFDNGTVAWGWVLAGPSLGGRALYQQSYARGRDGEPSVWDEYLQVRVYACATFAGRTLTGLDLVSSYDFETATWLDWEEEHEY